MYELINDKTLAEYEAFLQQHPKGHFAQSSLWAKQKPMWAWNAVAVRGEDGKIKGSLALMSRKVPGIGRTLLYGCRGPVCDLRDRETFAELLEGFASAVALVESTVAFRSNAVTMQVPSVKSTSVPLFVSLHASTYVPLFILNFVFYGN